MRHHFIRILGLSAAALALASTAQAQGKSQDKAHGKSAAHAKQSVKAKQGQDVRTSAGVLRRDSDRDRDRDVYGSRDVYGNGTKVPPGLAKKPGQMPPGQYKKRYGTNEGADVLGGILRRRGYSVTRIVPAGDSRYVYYRLRDGSERRAIVRPGTDRLSFSNVPAALLQEVLAALY
jgi:hypothetical protein